MFDKLLKIDLPVIHEVSKESEEEEEEDELWKPLTPKDRRQYVRRLIPSEIEKRVQPLKELQYELQKIQDEYCREVFELERRYHDDTSHFYVRREKIVNGSHEPDEETNEALAKEALNEVNLVAYSKFYNESHNLPEDYLGVPNFWLHIFTTSDTISQIVYEPDIEALKYLRDLTIDYDIKSFILEFHFNPNPYFENKVLAKEYMLESKLDEENDPCGFEGFRITKCRGCRIYWKHEQNLTIKLVPTKKYGRFQVVRVDSFFNFFKPPEVDSLTNNPDLDNETREALSLDFKIGNYFREEIIPKALSYFTGDIVDNLDEIDPVNDSDEECTDLMVRDDDKHIANVARILHKVHWS